MQSRLHNTPRFDSQTLKSVVFVNAPVSRVWRLLTDVDHLARWNPLVISASGQFRRGGMVIVYHHFPGIRSGACQLHMDRLIEGEEVGWSSFLYSPLLMRNDHNITLLQMPGGYVRVDQTSRFVGVLPGFFWSRLEGRLREGFERMNHSLKREAEGWRAVGCA